MTPAVAVLGNDICESASKFSYFFVNGLYAGSHQNLTPMLLLETFFFIELTFSVIMPFHKVHLRTLFPLFAVLEKDRAAP